MYELYKTAKKFHSLADLLFANGFPLMGRAYREMAIAILAAIDIWRIRMGDNLEMTSNEPH